MLRDRLVCGVSHDKIQNRLLAETNLTYDKAMELVLAQEAADKDMKELRKPKELTDSGRLHFTTSTKKLASRRKCLLATIAEVLISPMNVSTSMPNVTPARRKDISRRFVERSPERSHQSKPTGHLESHLGVNSRRKRPTTVVPLLRDPSDQRPPHI